MVRFLVVEPAHPGSSPRLGSGAHTFLNLFIPVLVTMFVQWETLLRLTTSMPLEIGRAHV